TSRITWGDPGSSVCRIITPALAKGLVLLSEARFAKTPPSRNGWCTKPKLSPVPQISLPAPDTVIPLNGDACCAFPAIPTAPTSVNCHGGDTDDGVVCP